ncbi:MarR family transcriptional regulator [archaeon]|nr:MarR family transcriptional regulator [archaeon]
MARLEITIRKLDRPLASDFDQEFAFFCRTLGFFEPIDKEKIASKIFKEIILATEQGRGISSNDLSQKLLMSRGAITNHLNNLLAAGLVLKEGRVYKARCQSVQLLVDELQSDLERIFFEMRKIARDLDKEFWKESQD